MTDHAANVATIINATLNSCIKDTTPADREHMAAVMVGLYVDAARKLKKAGLLDGPVPSVPLPVSEDTAA